MGIIQKDALRTTIISYLGLVLGYVNKGILFIWFLSTEQIGLVNLLLAVGLLFGNLSGLGSSYAVWKFFPFLKNKEKRHHGLLVLTLLISLIGGVIFAAIALLFQDQIVEAYKSRSEPFVHYYFWIIPLGFANLFFVIFDTFLRSMYYNVVSVFMYEFVLRLSITLLLVAFGLNFINFNSFLVIHCLIYFVPVIALAVYMYGKNELHLSFKYLAIPKRFRKIILSFGLISYVNSVGGLVVTTLDAMMIASMIGLKATGVYTTVVYLTSALQIPYKSMIRVSSPLVADQWKEKNMVEMNKLYKKFSSVNLVIAITLFLMVWICREELFHFLPPEFHDGIWVFLFLMIGRLTDMYMGINGIILSLSKKYQYDILFTSILIVIVWIMNLILIPMYGIIGSAIATCAAYLVYNIARVIFVYAVYKIHPFEIRQLYVLSLFTGVLIFFEVIPQFTLTGPVVSAIIKWILLGILFLCPIYFLRLEPEIRNYIDKGFLFLRKKVKFK